MAEVILYLEAKARVAEELGLTLDGTAKLRGILHARADNFRVEFGHDPPVRVAPMKVRLREGAAPVRSQLRRYSPNDRAFLDRHTASLLKYGLIYKNHRSRWASAPRIVRKKGQDVDPTADPRITIDTRSVNERTEPMPWPMPVQEVVLEIFGDLLGVSVLALLADILGFAEDDDALLDVLDTVLERCEKFGLKLHAKKCQFFSREIKWCGRMISGDGMPTTAGELQQFLCAVNWMRQSIPEFTRITTKLYDALERAAQHAGSRKKLKLSRVRLEEVGWGEAEISSLEAIWGCLLRMVPLAHPKATAELALYTDASQDHWEEADFVWPTANEIGALQQQAQDDGEDLDGAVWNAERQLMMIDEARVGIPAGAAELQQRLCVIARAGASGHRGAQTTIRALGAIFYWRTLEADVSTFVVECLHYAEPNELLHFDFLTMVEGDGDAKYVLVLKDDMSGYVELIACAPAGADQAYHGLMDWFKRFGVVLLWRALGAHHHFKTAYTPWANGTVEVVNREILKSIKALLSELRLHVRDWPAILPVVQAALNAMPADRLGGKTPLTAFKALPGGAQLHSILHPREPVDASIEWVDSEVQRHLRYVRVALDAMHTEMVNASERRRRAARERHARRQGVRLQKFSEGDFVLAATATGRSGHKLALVWRGPMRIVRALNDYTFEVQDIIAPFAISIRHASRLQLYRDAARGRVEELQEQAIYGEGGHLVEALRQCRLSPATHRWEVEVKWSGLDEIEASWEPAEMIKEVVPALFDDFVIAQPDDQARTAMTQAFRSPTPVPSVRPPRLPRSRHGRASRRVTNA
uniref:Chromo domain-containing protein n=1 Tax=Phytophthora ramorum TaxID=164328 RepID=H3GD34_PHYRM